MCLSVILNTESVKFKLNNMSKSFVKDVFYEAIKYLCLFNHNQFVHNNEEFISYIITLTNTLNRPFEISESINC